MAKTSNSTSSSTTEPSQTKLPNAHQRTADTANIDTPPTPGCSTPASSAPCIAVLLCTKDGARFLDEQVKSIHNQNHQNIHIYASDDGSIDKTQSILHKHQQSWNKEFFSIKTGPQQGFAANFLSLACSPAIEADYFAFSDQDDIWESDKLSRAISKLKTISPNTPALYCSRTQLIDESGFGIGYTPLCRKPPSFANSLVQSIASGNTMVFNQAAHKILCNAGQQEVASHDWWTYSLVTGVGGIVFYDSHPSVQYRQHDNNVLGASPGWRATLLRIRLIMKGRFQGWNTLNIHALEQARELLTPENRETLDTYTRARSRWLLPRAIGLWRSGVYRQSFSSHLGLAIATLLNKV